MYELLQQGLPQGSYFCNTVLTRLASDDPEQRQYLPQHPRSSARQQPHPWSRYYPRRASSACVANVCRIARNSRGWSMKSPSSVNALIVATAPPLPAILVGRMIETGGNLRLRKMVGSGMIRLVWVSSLPEALRFGNTSPLVVSVRGIILPALSCHV